MNRSVVLTRPAALDRLAEVVPRAGHAYAANRNTDPGPLAEATTTALSPYLRRRLLLEQEVVEAALAAHGLQAAGRFIDEVFWRSYFKGHLETHPTAWTRYTEALADEQGRLAANSGRRRAYEAAVFGRTGIDGFDDWARELVDTGWLHNHARMWFASIWTFTLRLSWVLGADFFLRHLLDGDPASNTLSWRWVAGLHTRGKAYAARAENIRRYTAGRFSPAGLNENPVPLDEPDPPHSVPLPPAEAAPSGDVALLLHLDDLHPESLELGRARVARVGGLLAHVPDASERVRHADGEAMADALTRPLRPDFDALRLRRAARASQDARQTRRLLALAVAYDGTTRTRAAEIGGVTLQVVRDWVVRFNAQGPDGLIDCKAPGQLPRLDGQHRAALAAVIESGPTPAIHGVVRWRLIDLCQWVWDEFRISVSRQTLGRELHAMNYRKLSARPRHHAQAEGAIEAFTRDFPSILDAIARDHGVDPTAVEVWFGDEARIGQKNKITRRWARRGTRPSAPQDQRTASTYIFGAICPKQGKAAGLILPWCNTEAMSLHLNAISAEIAPGRHAVLLVDQAGWHTSTKLAVPANITLVHLPAKCPELNPQENVWQFMRENWLSNRVFTSYDNLVDHCCAAWNKLIDQPWRIMSLGLRQTGPMSTDQRALV